MKKYLKFKFDLFGQIYKNRKDVREAAEYLFNHISNAVSIPLGELEERLNELNKNDEICHSLQ